MPFEFFHTITRLFLLIWLCGGGYIAYNTFRGYRELYSTIRCYPNLLISNPGISAILSNIYAENPVPHPVKKVIRTQFVTTPCITGFYGSLRRKHTDRLQISAP